MFRANQNFHQRGGVVLAQGVFPYRLKPLTVFTGQLTQDGNWR
jgi:hypothetical protein